MRRAHHYTRPTLEAAQILGLEIARGRRARRWSAEELAQRVGIAKTTLYRVERGDPAVAIGIVFELATVLAIPLFGVERNALASLVERARDRVALLPERVREPDRPLNDDF